MSQPETERYLDYVAGKFDLRGDIHATSFDAIAGNFDRIDIRGWRWSEIQVQGGPVPGTTVDGRCGAGPAGCAAVGGANQPYPEALADVFDQGGEIAAVADDGLGEFPPQRVARHDSQVATDIGENGTGRAAADLGRDVPRRGQTGDAWFACAGAFVQGLGGARLARDGAVRVASARGRGGGSAWPRARRREAARG